MSGGWGGGEGMSVCGFRIAENFCRLVEIKYDFRGENFADCSLLPQKVFRYTV